MKIAIHHSVGSFSEAWIAYCKQQGISYKLVNAFDTNIIDETKDCDVFMWHHHHAVFKDVLAAKNILFALEHAGVTVFPDFKTGWHFDDKVAQKYLLEATNAPLVPSYVFYDKEEAEIWAKTTSYPIVFKLKGGAGATNVKLVKSKDEAFKLINQAFGKGFAQFDRLGNLRERFNRFKNKQDSLVGLSKGLARLVVVPEFSKQQAPEKGYVYFQQFIPNNDCDVRVVVINGEVAVAEKRFVRKNDFRASGSGMFSYENIDPKTIEISFEIAKKLNLQSVAFDFVINNEGEYLIVEVSYGFGTTGIENAPGYWDKEMNWHEKAINLQGLMIDGLLNTQKKQA